MQATQFPYRDICWFPNLTPLRSIAAMLVVIFHVEETRKMFGVQNLTHYSFFTHGPMAVTFFFVLSGFLITYLLLRERAQAGRIAVARFYARRILRIWPLYFLMVLIGLVLVPIGITLGRVPYEAPFTSWEVAPYFIFFMPFLVNLMYGNHILTPLWSIGVEEIYYLGWAPVANWLHRHLAKIMVLTIAIKLVLASAAYSYAPASQVTELLRMLQFEAMAFGGLAAWVVFHRTARLEHNVLFSRSVQVAVCLLLVAQLIAHRTLASSFHLYAVLFDHRVLSPPLMMALFAWLIVNVGINERNVLKLDSHVLNYLGDISYGIYVYHALFISLVFVPAQDFYRSLPAPLSALLLHISVGLLTLIAAAISKRFFENAFLRYKPKMLGRPSRQGGAGAMERETDKRKAA